jgi:hypothetical protein
MAGKLCFGEPKNNAWYPRTARAFCEGMQNRYNAVTLVTENPHEIGSEDSDAWILGWTVSDDAVGTTIDPADAPCCAVPHGVVPA